MSEENRIGTYQFVAEPFHVDFNGRLTMGVLGNHLLNCAGFHANDRGFGIATLNEDNYTWVLSRLAIELDHILDLFPIELYKTKRIRRFEMAYVAESYFGDELSFFCDEVNANEFHVEVKKNGNEVVCRSKVIFE